jgi:hypothetical protein
LIPKHRRTRKLQRFAEALDNAMRKQNMYYDDLIVGKVLKKVVVTKVVRFQRIHEIDW